MSTCKLRIMYIENHLINKTNFIQRIRITFDVKLMGKFVFLTVLVSSESDTLVI